MSTKNSTAEALLTPIDVESQLSGTEIDSPNFSKGVSKWKITNPLLRECLAEFIGTFVLIMFGDGVVAQKVLSDGKNGEYLSINLCWGLAVMFGIYFSGGVSGAHLNPAVTFTLAVFKRFEWKKLPYYIFAQIFGAFIGAAFVYLVYYPALQNTGDITNIKYAGIFATYPQDFETIGGSFFTEFMGTLLLLAGIFAIGDSKNSPASAYTKPAAVGLLVVAIGMAFGFNTGYAINPARDFGPRLFTAVGPWGSKVFTANNYYFWVPVVAPLFGGVFGGAVYYGFVEAHHS